MHRAIVKDFAEACKAWEFHYNNINISKAGSCKAAADGFAGRIDAWRVRECE